MSTENEKGVDTMRKNVCRRKDGRWQYAKQENGLKYFAIASSYRKLIDKINKIRPKEVKDIKHANARTNQSTFANYYQYFIDNYIKNKKIGEETKKDWQRQCDRDILPYFAYRRLDDLTTEDIQNFVDSIQQERKQEVLYQRVVKVLNKAYATGKMKRNITLGVEKPKRENVLDVPPLTFYEQVGFLREVKKTPYYAFAVFSIIVGSRREETMRFNLSTDIDERRQQIHIKGTKTINADRYVKVTKEFIQFLKDNMSSNTFDFHASTATHELGAIFKRLKIENGRLHSLRHTCSANLYFLGATDKYRQMQLGHASIVTTNDIYTNIKENIDARRLRLIYGNLYPAF